MRPIAILFLFLSYQVVNGGVQLLSKSKLEKCEKVSYREDVPLNCTKKVVLNLAVPSESSGQDASIVAEVVEVEENSTGMRTVREPPVITISKSAAYAQYHLTYDRDVAFRPVEIFAKTRKCNRNGGADVVHDCVPLKDDNGHVREDTKPKCCPCGQRRRVPSSCPNFFNKMAKGKANTAHCLRFPGDWFHVFSIDGHTVGFEIRVQVKTGSKVSEIVISPHNRTAVSHDKFLRVNLIGDYAGYHDTPAFENTYLVIPREGSREGQPESLGRNYSMWMILEKTRFSDKGDECNKIGTSFAAFRDQPDFCNVPFMSCLHNQLYDYWEGDENRRRKNQVPRYGVQGRFERINEHPNAGSKSFSIGVNGVLNSNLMIELSADDIEYVFQRSPGQIENITTPTFEALTQFGVTTITARNTGEVEASYSLTLDCSLGISKMEEQFFNLKPKQVATRSFKVYAMSDQAAKYACSAILKDSDYQEADRASCQFTTTATVLDNGTLLPWEPPKSDIRSFFESIEDFFFWLWHSMIEFITGKTCNAKCSGIFDFGCHIKHICLKWVVMFSLIFAVFPLVIVLLWLLHENGVFDSLYDWWEDHFWDDERKAQHLRKHHQLLEHHYKKHHKKSGGHKKEKVKFVEHHTHNHNHRDHVKKEKHKHGDEGHKEHHKDKHVSKHDKHHKHKRRNSLP